MSSKFDLAVIGAGQAGIWAADRASELGARVALIEKGIPGGTCQNIGCIPTKAMVRSAEVANLARRAAEFGVIAHDVGVNLADVQSRQKAIVAQRNKRLLEEIESIPNLELIRSAAQFESPTRIAVDGGFIEAPKTIIATGATSIIPSLPGLDSIDYLISDDLLELTTLPQRIVFIGGGTIAMELGQVFHRFGAEITVLVRGDRILRNQDADIASCLTGLLRREGVDIRTKTLVTSLEPYGGRSVVVASDADGRERRFEAEAVVLATGRRAFVDRLALDQAGVVFTSRGIEVDPQMRTTAENIWAAGDVVGDDHAELKHTPVALERGIVAAENALGVGGRQMDYRFAPQAVFTDPEIGSVGLTEAEALQSGYKIRVGRYDMTMSPRAHPMGEGHGIVKTIIEDQTNRLLGMHICAHGAAELIHIGIVAMNAGDGRVDPLINSLMAHPTLSEGVQNSAEAAVAAEPIFDPK